MADEPTTPPAGGEPTAEPAKGDQPKTFDQDAVDRIVEQRLARERQKFGDYDDLKTKAAKLDEIEQGQKTDLEKANERASSTERERDDARRELQEMRITSALSSAASAKGVRRPDMAAKLIDWSALDFDDAGKPKNAEKLVDKLIEDMPELTGSRPNGGGFDGGVRQTAPSGGIDSMIRQAAGRQ